MWRPRPVDCRSNSSAHCSACVLPLREATCPTSPTILPTAAPPACRIERFVATLGVGVYNSPPNSRSRSSISGRCSRAVRAGLPRCCRRTPLRADDGLACSSRLKVQTVHPVAHHRRHHTGHHRVGGLILGLHCRPLQPVSARRIPTAGWAAADPTTPSAPPRHARWGQESARDEQGRRGRQFGPVPWDLRPVAPATDLRARRRGTLWYAIDAASLLTDPGVYREKWPWTGSYPAHAAPAGGCPRRPRGCPRVHVSGPSRRPPGPKCPGQHGTSPGRIASLRLAPNVPVERTDHPVQIRRRCRTARWRRTRRHHPHGGIGGRFLWHTYRVAGSAPCPATTMPWPRVWPQPPWPQPGWPRRWSPHYCRFRGSPGSFWHPSPSPRIIPGSAASSRPGSALRSPTWC